MREIMDVSYGKEMGKNAIRFKTKNRYFMCDEAIEYDESMEEHLKEVIYGNNATIKSPTNTLTVLLSDESILKTDEIVSMVREYITKKKNMNEMISKFESDNKITEEYEI